VRGGRPDPATTTSHPQAPAGRLVAERHAPRLAPSAKTLNGFELKGKIKAPSLEPRLGVWPEAGSIIENIQWAARVNALSVTRARVVLSLQNHIDPQNRLHHQPVIVCAVLNVFPIGTDLCAQGAIEMQPTEFAPLRLIEATPAVYSAARLGV